MKWLIRFFNNAKRRCWNFIKACLPDLTTILIGKYGPAAYEVCKKLQAEDISKEEKHNMAVENIRAIAKIKGDMIRDNIVDILIKLAVERLKQAING